MPGLMPGLSDDRRANRFLREVARRRCHARIKMEAAVEEVINMRPPFAFTFGVRVADTNLLEKRDAVRVLIEPVMRAAFPVAVDHLLRALVAGEREIAVVVLVLGAEVPGFDRAEP